jgi:hypothetical protein
MAEYQLTATGVLRIEDQAHIPNEPLNRDWQEYLNWVEAGGVADPYVAPEPVPPAPAAETTVLYDHENRIRAIEGQPPLTLREFIAMKGRLT